MHGKIQNKDHKLNLQSKIDAIVLGRKSLGPVNSSPVQIFTKLHKSHSW